MYRSGPHICRARIEAMIERETHLGKRRDIPREAENHTATVRVFRCELILIVMRLRENGVRLRL